MTSYSSSNDMESEESDAELIIDEEKLKKRKWSQAVSNDQPLITELVMTKINCDEVVNSINKMHELAKGQEQVEYFDSDLLK